jgi:hypothetical protein
MGTVEQHCPMGDPQALKVHTLLSLPAYATAIVVFVRCHLGSIGLFCSLPLVPIFVWQAWWGVELFAISNVRGMSACALILGEEDYWEVGSSLFELSIAPIYISMSVSSLLALAYSHWRYRSSAAESTVAVIFD